MKIKDILNELQAPDIKTGVNVLGKDITTGDVASVANALGISPTDAVRYGMTAYDIATRKIPGTNYSVADAVKLGLDVAPIGRALKAGKLMAKGDKAGSAKAIGQAGALTAASRLARTGVSVDPSDSKSSSTPPAATKRSRFAVGDKISVPVSGETYKLPIIGIVPSGYLVDASSIPGRKSGDTMTVPEKLDEAATEGTTSSGSVASLGQSPHVAAGAPAVIKRWSGSPGKTGKSIKHTPVKSQSAKDNPVTNPKVGNNLVA
jgi:hypothetical protein